MDEFFNTPRVGEQNNSGNYDSSNSIPKAEYLMLDEIRRDGGTQPRAKIDLRHIQLLEQQIEDGKRLEPITVFYDGESYWLADGFHRWHAHRNQSEDAIACAIYQGSQRDAILYSVGANADNKPALPRNQQDKRQAVLTLLQDPEWSQWSDREISRQCKVSDRTVNRLRQSICVIVADTKVNKDRKAKRGGKTYTVDTTNIGKTSAPLSENHRVTINNDHPLFPGQSGKIVELPDPDSAVVELDNGQRELISLKDLNMEEKPNYHLNIPHHLQLVEGGLVKMRVPDNKNIDGRLGRIAKVSDRTVEVWVRNVERMAMHLYTLKHQLVELVPLETEPDLARVCDRINVLKQRDLDPFELEILNLLERPVVFTPIELEYLTRIEMQHGIVN